MAAVVHTSWLTPLLRRLPRRLLAQLDNWSHRVAMRRAQQRREAGRRRLSAQKNKDKKKKRDKKKEQRSKKG